jgi:hypothetical protein
MQACVVQKEPQHAPRKRVGERFRLCRLAQAVSRASLHPRLPTTVLAADTPKLLAARGAALTARAAERCSRAAADRAADLTRPVDGDPLGCGPPLATSPDNERGGATRRRRRGGNGEFA